MIPTEPLTATEARRVIRDAVSAGLVRLTDYSRGRLALRDISLPIVVTAWRLR